MPEGGTPFRSRSSIRPSTLSSTSMTPGHCAGPRQVRGAVTSPSAAKILRPGRHPCGPGCSARMPPCWNVGLPRWPMRCAMTTPEPSLSVARTPWAHWGRRRNCSLVRRPAVLAAVRDERAGAVVIHVLADAEALEAGPDPLMSGEGPHRVQPITRDTSLAELMAPQSEGELPAALPRQCGHRRWPRHPEPVVGSVGRRRRDGAPPSSSTPTAARTDTGRRPRCRLSSGCVI